MLGSHFDTVRDAGTLRRAARRVTAIACVEELNRAAGGCRLRSRSSASPTRRACASARRCSAAARSPALSMTACSSVRDADGITMREALERFGLDPDAYRRRARIARELLAYLELHIEQGPVLEAAGSAGRRASPPSRRNAAGGAAHRHGRPCRHRADGAAARCAGGRCRMHRRDRGILPHRCQASSARSATSTRCRAPPT